MYRGEQLVNGRETNFFAGKAAIPKPRSRCVPAQGFLPVRKWSSHVSI
jgi:hypothetical protein